MNHTITMSIQNEPVAIISPEFPTAVGEFMHLFGGMFRDNWPETLAKLNAGKFIGPSETFLDPASTPAKGEWPLHDMLLDAFRTLDKMMREEVEYNVLEIETTRALVKPGRRQHEDLDDDTLPF